MNHLYSRFLNHVEHRRRSVGSMNSFADRLLEKKDNLNWTRHGLSFMAGPMIEAGSDTTSGVINNFLLLMTQFPGAMRKGQEKINAVVGVERSHRWHDWQNLTEVNKLPKETLRMRPVAPYGMGDAASMASDGLGGSREEPRILEDTTAIVAVLPRC